MKHAFKHFLSRYFPERTIEEVAIHLRVLLYTTVPNSLFPTRRSRLRRARSLTRLKLNIGCGGDNAVGWFGVDFLSPAADLRLDTSQGLPFQDGSCLCVFSEHVFEHFDRKTLRRVLRESFRVLATDSPIRIVVPNLEAYIAAYNKNDGVFSAQGYTTQGHLATHELVNDVFYLPTHRYMHDFPSLESELKLAGFSEVSRSEQGLSRFEVFDIDNPAGHRKAVSLYVEAVKRCAPKP